MVVNVAWVGENRNSYKIMWGKHGGRSYPEDQGIDWRIILKSFLEKHACSMRTIFICLRSGTGSGLF
jgi:hypothetical protein